MDTYLSISGVVIYLLAFLVYNLELLRGKSSPSKTTWTMWAALMILYAVTYRSMTGDLIKSLQGYGGLVCNVSTCLLVWFHGGTSDFNRQNWKIIAVSVMAILVWWLTHDATWSNLLLLATIAYSMVPMFKNVWINPKSERPLPWFMFSFSYAVQIVVVVLRYTQPQDLAAPIGGMLLHLAVGIIALRHYSQFQPIEKVEKSS